MSIFLILLSSLLGTLGIGSVISILLAQHWERKKLIYETKLNIYSNFIEAYQNSVAKPHNVELKQNCVACQKKIELLAPLDIVELSRQFYQSAPHESPKIRDNLIEKMRRDLGSI
jgi:hypothetical protein